MSWTYKGYSIETNTEGRFYLTQDAMGLRFDSLAQAQKRADYLVERAEAKLELPCISYNGETVMVKGVYSAGDYITEPSGSWYGARAAHSGLYPDVPFIRQLVERKVALETEASHINLQLRRFQLPRKKGKQSSGANQDTEKEWERCRQSALDKGVV